MPATALMVEDKGRHYPRTRVEDSSFGPEPGFGCFAGLPGFGVSLSLGRRG